MQTFLGGAFFVACIWALWQYVGPMALDILRMFPG